MAKKSEHESAAPEVPKSEPAGEESPQEKATNVGQPEAAKLLSPLDWALRLGKVSKPSPLKINGAPRGSRPSWDHAAADQLHGWTAHATHSAEPLVISEVDYLAALAAASRPSGPEGSRPKYLPHPAALSPFAPRGR